MELPRAALLLAVGLMALIPIPQAQITQWVQRM